MRPSLCPGGPQSPLVPWFYHSSILVFLEKCLLAKGRNPPSPAKTKGEFIGRANPETGRAFGFVPGPYPLEPQRIKG